MRGVLRVAVALAVVVASGSCAGGQGEQAPSAAQPSTHLDHATLELKEVSACLQEAGWKVTLDPGNGYSSAVPETQRAAYQGDRKRCEDEFLREHPRPAMTEADWTKLYRHQVWLVDCLEAQGFPPVGEPPSEADYVGDGLSGVSPSWYAWGAVSGAPTPELEARCPQAPPGL